MQLDTILLVVPGMLRELPMQLFVGRGEHGHGDASKRRDAAPSLQVISRS